MAKKLKNAWHKSTKHEPVMKLFKPPNVIVFANMCPQHDKLTAGRLEQIDMEEKQQNKFGDERARYEATVAAALVFLDSLNIQGQWSSLLVGKCKTVFLNTPFLLFSRIPKYKYINY